MHFRSRRDSSVLITRYARRAEKVRLYRIVAAIEYRLLVDTAIVIIIPFAKKGLRERVMLI